MGSVNKVILVGNLGRDAETRYVASGTAVAKFSLACTEKWRDKSGESKERTEWVTVELWGKRAEGLAEYLTKGSQVYVEGKLQTDEWDDKDGNKRKMTKVRADDIVLLGGKRREAAEPKVQPAAATAGPDEDDIPF